MTGESITIERTFTQDDFDRFARLSGDDNPIHVDADFASRTRFGRTVAHGMLLNLVLRELQARLVPGARQIAQQLRFSAPTYADETMRFTAGITARRGAQVTVEFRCTRVADDVVTCEGVGDLQADES